MSKVAILIDGGYFLTRLPTVFKSAKPRDPESVAMALRRLIASLTLKRQVDTIVLVAGDSDFVPASKLARREGVKVVLDPLWRSVAPELFEHIDGLQSGFPKPGTAAAKQAGKDEDVE